MAGLRGRLLKVSPLRTGFWSSISWLMNLQGEEDEGEGLEPMDVDLTLRFANDLVDDLIAHFFIAVHKVHAFLIWVRKHL